MIYLDNAATSYPKPQGVSDRMKEYLDLIGAPVNRSVYARAQDAGLVELQLRERLARIFNFPESPTQVLLTAGATAALNQAIFGYLRPGDHCLVSSMEHNAVMRPLQMLAQRGVSFDRIPCGIDGALDLQRIEPLIRPNTRLLVLVHGSNVCGTVQDAAAVGKICARHGIAFVLDAAQTAGHCPVDFKAFGLSALAVPGHKGLLGPSGIGALLVTREFADALTPLLAGGTGSASDSELLPPYLPDRFESGTPNLPGIYGWEKALAFVEETGIDALSAHEKNLTGQFLHGLEGIHGIRVCGKHGTEQRVGVLSVDFETCDNAQAAARLESEFGILTRCGLHCAPSAHKTLGTFPEGTVRFSIGFANSPEEIQQAVHAISQIAEASVIL
ncbi:MAG: aminotransferase class V-fold PLP-dependent enzyme [Oscillibacter sp.]|jgi:cysteine desulfurase family protein|nr:aminotransferase class V-fold PLP-dependent enzyme [Oscillibacter sp.]